MGTQEVKSTIKTQSKDPDTINTIIPPIVKINVFLS